MKTMMIIEGVNLIATAKTCNRISEALQLYRDAKELLSNPIPDEWDWDDYDSEIDYCFSRAELLLGLTEPNQRLIECYGNI